MHRIISVSCSSWNAGTVLWLSSSPKPNQEHPGSQTASCQKMSALCTECVQETVAVTLPQICCLSANTTEMLLVHSERQHLGGTLSGGCQALGSDSRHWPRCCCLFVLLETENANSLARYLDKQPCVTLTVG